MPLENVSHLLSTKHSFMFSFMERYIFSQIQVPRKETISNPENFGRMIDFCLRTKQRIRQNELLQAQAHFSNNFENIRKSVHQGDWINLLNLVYSTPGVGQKIGSLILEVIIHYGEANTALESQLFVPIDTHVQRIFTQCLGLNNVPPIGTPVYSKRYIAFQRFLSENAADGVSRIYFDYLWFVGKFFCRKINETEEGYSKGFRLCPMCWIKDDCIFPDKWNIPI
jgi:endonuclease III